VIQDTSIKSFFEHQEQMNHDDAIVLKELLKAPGTIREIAVRLGWESGRVSARLNALQEPTYAEKEAHRAIDPLPPAREEIFCSGLRSKRRSSVSA